jgi:beta-xylosidase
VPDWSGEHLWAPEVVERRGLYYMTYSARNPQTGRHDIGIATSSSPLGPFQDRAILVRAGEGEVGVIDATIFTDTDGSAYLIYSREAPRAIILTGLTDDWLGVTPERTDLLYSDRPWEKGVAEAPSLVLRGGVYHLFYSGGPFQGRKHREMYAVGHAVSRRLRGPYIKDDARIMESVKRRVHGPGHQCVVRLDSGEDWMFYHAWDDREEPFYGSNPAGRTLRLDRLYLDGPRAWVNGPSTGPRVRPAVLPPRS